MADQKDVKIPEWEDGRHSNETLKLAEGHISLNTFYNAMHSRESTAPRYETTLRFHTVFKASKTREQARLRGIRVLKNRLSQALAEIEAMERAGKI